VSPFVNSKRYGNWWNNKKAKSQLSASFFRHSVCHRVQSVFRFMLCNK